MSDPALFKGMVEGMAAGLWALDGRGRTTYVNPWLAHWLGCETTDMIGGGVEAFLFPDDVGCYAERCSRVGRGRGEAWEQRFRGTSGGELWGWVSAVRGVEAELLITVQDIGARQLADEQLRSSEWRFRTIAEEAADAQVWLDPQFRLLWINRLIERITGYTAAECLAMPSFPSPLVPVEDWVNLRSEMEQTDATDDGKEHRFRFFRRDGESRWGSATLRFVRDEQQRPLGWRVSVRDVTAQVRAEEDLDQYRLVVSATRDGVALLDDEYRYRIVNDTYEELAGHPKEQLLGRSVSEYLGAEVFSKVLQPNLDRCLRGEVLRFEDWFSYPSGARRRMLVTYFPYRDREGRVKGVVANSRDTTDQWEAERALRESEEFRKVVFDSVASHLAVLDQNGVIVAVNQAWLRFARENADTNEPDAQNGWVGFNYLTVCRCCTGPDARSARDACLGIVEVLEGRRQSFSLDYPCHSPTEHRWFSMVATALGGDRGGVVVAHTDISRLELAQEALKQSEARWRSYLANAPVGVIVANSEGRHLDANSWAEQMFGYGPGELRGTRIDELPDEEYLERCQALFRDLQQTGTMEAEVRLRRKDGTRLWAAVRGSRLPGACFLAVFQDITERRETEDMVRRLSQAVEQSPASVVITDLHGKLEYVNRRFCETTGYTKEEALGQNISFLKSGKTAPEVYRHLWDTIGAGRDWDGEFLNRRKNGELFWERAVISPIRDPGGRFSHYLGIKEDITLRKRADEELQSSREQLRALTSALSRTEHRERRRIALLLHDEVIQRMAVAQIQLGQLQADLWQDASPCALIAGIRGHIERAIVTTRTMTFQLSPPILHELGLAPALGWLAEQFADEHSLRCECALDPAEVPLDEETRNLLFAAARELLMNVVKHARASKCWISMSLKNGEVEVEVVDNGIGFNSGAPLPPPNQHGGFGLFSLRERLGFLGGGCRIESSPGEGTRAKIWAPAPSAGVGEVEG